MEVHLDDKHEKIQCTFSTNDYVTIYPSEDGWQRILAHYNHTLWPAKTYEVIADIYASKKTKDGGYRDQLWQIMNDFGMHMYNGSTFLESTKIIVRGGQ